MKNNLSLKILILFIFTYFIWPFLANFIAAMNGAFIGYYFIGLDDYVTGKNFSTVMIFSFSVPVLLLLLYNYPLISFLRSSMKNELMVKKGKWRMMHAPLAYGIISIVGWTVAFITLLVITRVSQDAKVIPDIRMSFFYTMTSAILCMTITYYSVEIINQRYILDAFFPGESLFHSGGKIRLSIRGKFMIFFIAVSAYPVFLFVDFIYMFHLRQKLIGPELMKSIMVLAVVLLIMGVLITLLVSSHFKDPLDGLAGAARKIRKGDYSTGIQVRSGDELGLLGETFNEMTEGLREKERLEKRNRIVEMEKRELEQEIQFAQKVQFALLPNVLPEMERARVAFTYAPMLWVGGDLVDVYYSEKYQRVGLFICDVSGHGVSAAMTAVMVKMALSAWGETLSSPAETLSHVREAMKGKLVGSFITAAVCSVDLLTGKACIARAGHPPILVVRENGPLEELNPSGRLITDMVSGGLREEEIQLNPKDKIIMYTDGVIEARKGDEMLGDRAFHEIIMGNAERDADDLCKIVYRKVKDFAAPQQLDDDLTILIFEMV